MVGIKNSLRTQLIFSSVVGLAFVILSVAYILFATIRLQRVVNDQFSTERFLQELQREVVAIREPLLDYLSSRSSGALAELLVEEQILRGMVPAERPISTDPVTLAGREIYFLLDSYLDLLQRAIDLKRARAIEDYIALYDEMERLNQHIVERIDRVSLLGLRTELDAYEELIARSRRMLFWNLVVIVAAFLSSSAWILFAIRRVTDPMDHLARTASELSDGNFEVEDIEVDTVREMATVVAAFNRMKHDIRRYIAELNRRSRLDQEYMEQKLRNLKMEQILKRMELYTMQAQMNPHFLFNTLNTGVQLAIMERADRTADFMEHLAHFFRHNIRERDLIVPLRHEIEGLSAYLYILRIRFPKSLQFTLEVPEELLDTCRVPALILQPLVENSVIHAFEGVERSGEIVIRVWKANAVIHLSVRDNGIGMAPTTASRLLQRSQRDIEHGSKVMGLENVIQRLYFFFPSLENTVTIKSAPDAGTEILIMIDTRVEACIPS